MKSEHTPLEFSELYHKWCQEGTFDHTRLDFGDYEGKPFLIVESHEDLAEVICRINGYTGNCRIAVLWHGDNVHAEFNKAEAELIKARAETPDHLGTISRLEARLKQLAAYCNYKQWLYINEIEEVGLEDFDIDCGFSDEYSLCACSCNGCNNVVRTSPDSYSWTPPLFLEAEGYVCDDCAPNYKDYVIEQYRNEAKSIPDQFDAADLGLVKLNEDSFENGWYGGQCDEPTPIIKALNAEGVDCWFKVYPRQFDLEFDVYVKAEDQDKAKGILSGTNTKAKEDPAVLLERGLKAASKASASLQGEGIRYTKVNSDGTATARLVSNEEFIEGIKD